MEELEKRWRYGGGRHTTICLSVSREQASRRVGGGAWTVVGTTDRQSTTTTTHNNTQNKTNRSDNKVNNKVNNKSEQQNRFRPHGTGRRVRVRVNVKVYERECVCVCVRVHYITRRHVTSLTHSSITHNRTVRKRKLKRKATISTTTKRATEYTLTPRRRRSAAVRAVRCGVEWSAMVFSEPKVK